MTTRSAVAVTWVCGAWVASFSSLGCQVHSSRSTEPTAEKRVVSSRLDDAVLSDLGLTEDWFLPPADGENPVVHASLLPEGLFLSTQPTGSRAGKLMRIERATGKTVWSFDLEHGEALTRAPSVYHHAKGQSPQPPDELFFTQLDTVYMLDLKWGDPLRKYNVTFPVSTRIAVTSDRIFLGSDNGQVYALEKDTQGESWGYHTGGALLASPVLAGKTLICASQDGSVYRLSAAKGWVNGFSWKFETQAPVIADPVPFGNRVLVGSTDYKLYGLRAVDGEPLWEFLAEAPIEDALVAYSHRPGEDYVYCIGVEHTLRGDRRTLFAVNVRNGDILWRRKGVRKVVSLGRETLYVLDDAGPGGKRTISGLAIGSGEQKFRLDIDEFRFAPTNSADFGRNKNERGRIYLVGKDGAVQVLSEKF